MKPRKPSNERTLNRISGVLRALNRRDMSDTEALNTIARIVREEQTAEVRRKAS